MLNKAYVPSASQTLRFVGEDAVADLQTRTRAGARAIWNGFYRAPSRRSIVN
jgi:hypothetical protein